MQFPKTQTDHAENFGVMEVHLSQDPAVDVLGQQAVIVNVIDAGRQSSRCGKPLDVGFIVTANLER